MDLADSKNYFRKRIHMMKKVMAMPFTGALFLAFGLTQLITSPLIADELINISDVKDCQGIKGDAERLACYDTVVRGGVFNEQQLKQGQVEQFGSRSLRKPEEPEAADTSDTQAQGTAEASPAAAPAPLAGTKISVDQINVTVVRMAKDNMGKNYFQTSDGQVWKQQEASSWGLTVPFDAKIEKGAMGSFFLVNEGGKSTRVKRVK